MLWVIVNTQALSFGKSNEKHTMGKGIFGVIMKFFKVILKKVWQTGEASTDKTGISVQMKKTMKKTKRVWKNLCLLTGEL
jgi:hypothetical protein